MIKFFCMSLTHWKGKFRNKKNKFIPNLGDSYDVHKFIPDYAELHNESFESFLQTRSDKLARENIGLEYIFRSTFPVIYNKFQISYLYYELDEPEYTEEECVLMGTTYSTGLNIMFRITHIPTEKSKEFNSYAGLMPLVTKRGTFIVNGHEKVILGQVTRCPGIIFSKELDTNSQKNIIIAKIYPTKGSWLHITLDKDNLIYISIDKKKKMLLSTFLMSFPATNIDKLIDDINNKTNIETKQDELVVEEGYTSYQILSQLYKPIPLYCENERWILDITDLSFKRYPLPFSIYSENDDLLFEAGKTFNKSILKSNKVYIKDFNDIYLANIIYNSQTGEIYGETAEVLTKINAQKLIKYSLILKVFIPDDTNCEYLLKTWSHDNVENREVALLKVGESIKISRYVLPIINNILKSKFFNYNYYSLGKIGRSRINNRLNHQFTKPFVYIEDILQVARILGYIKNGWEQPDDLDSFNTRMIRLMGKSIEEYAKIGMNKVIVNLTKRLQILNEQNVFGDLDKIRGTDRSRDVLSDTINPRFITSSIMTLLLLSSISQLYNNTNRVAALSQLCKLNLTGRFGILSVSARAPTGCRSVHITELPLICPVHTPEGYNVGLVRHLGFCNIVDQDGFVLTPLHPVEHGEFKADNVKYVSSCDLKELIIASKTDFVPYYKDGILMYKAAHEVLQCQYQNKDDNRIGYFNKDNINYSTVIPGQGFSLSFNCIPLANTIEAYRSVVACSMNNQHISLSQPENPVIMTGIENHIADTIRYEGTNGIVQYVDSKRIIIENLDIDNISEKITVIYLPVNKQANQDTVINFIPRVTIGESVTTGDLLADGQSTMNGIISSGRSLLVSYLAGPTYEDSFAVSTTAAEKLISYGIKEFRVNVYYTMSGEQVLMKAIPGVAPEDTYNLGEDGVIKIGSEVKAGDILVGRGTPKVAHLTPEEKLIYSIYGSKAKEYSDNSLRVPNGIKGTVVDVKILSRANTIQGNQGMFQNYLEIEDYVKEINEKLSIFTKTCITKINNICKLNILIPANINYIELLTLKNKKVDKTNAKRTDNLFDIITHNLYAKSQEEIISKFYDFKAKFVKLSDEIQQNVLDICNELNDIVNDAKLKASKIINKIQKGYFFNSADINKVIVVYIATKEGLEVGDKLCGYHADKGVISDIRHDADMPFTEDGRNIDIIVNHIGLHARFNVIGQVFEVIISTYIKYLEQKLEYYFLQYIEILAYEYYAETKNHKDALDYFEQLGIDYWVAKNCWLRTINNIITNNKNSELKQNKTEVYNILKAFIIKAIRTRNLCEFVYQDIDIDEAHYSVILLVVNHLLYNKLAFVIPMFHNIDASELDSMIQEMKLEEGGKSYIYDGRTGEKMPNAVLVGYKYEFKLCHKARDKLNARSSGGAYSILTLQPVGGKSHGGGQRFGEMELWAVWAHGADELIRNLRSSDCRKWQEILQDGLLNCEPVSQFNLFNELLWKINNRAFDAIKNNNIKVAQTKKIDMNYESVGSCFPESIRLTVIELRALGIELSFYLNTGHNEVDIKDKDMVSLPLIEGENYV